MENPYVSPKTRISTEDEGVIELLVRYKQQLKAVNILRKAGMEYSQARALVAENVPMAQAVLNKQNRAWKITASILFLMSISVLGFIVYTLFLNFISVGLFCLLLYGSLTAFQRCDKIKF